MVTDDELAKIMKLRGQGLTHQEIADRLDLTRQTVAYQLSKRKENASIEKPVRVIDSTLQNSGNIAILNLSIEQFEELRENEIIYADGPVLFEMRGNCIHSCGWPQPQGRRQQQRHRYQWFIENYAALAPYIPIMLGQCDKRRQPSVIGWIYTLHERISQYKQAILPDPYQRAYNNRRHGLRKATYKDPQTRHPQLEALLQAKKRTVQQTRETAQKQLPESEFECAMLLLNDKFPTPPKEVNFDESRYMYDQVYIDYAEKLGIDEAQAREWLKNPASQELNISRDEFLQSGASNKNEFLQMMKEGFSNVKQYRNYLVIYQEIMGMPLQNDKNPFAATYSNAVQKRRHNRKSVPTNFSQNTPDERKIKSYVQYGWDKSWDIKNAISLGIQPESEESYYEMKDKIMSWGLDGTELSDFKWLKENGIENPKYKRFDAPRHGALFHIIDKSNSNRFLLDSLVEQYNAFDEPGIDLNKSELCSLLTSSPFDSLVVATLESGLVEKLSENVQVREIIREREVEVVKEVEVIKEVEQLSSQKALFDLTQYLEFSKLLEGEDFPEIREAALMLKNAIFRGELKTSYKEAWSVFGAIGRTLVDSENGGDFQKDLIERIVEQYNLANQDKDDLHKLRMIRNDIDKVKQGSKRRPTRNHLKNCMALIDKLICEMMA